MENKDQNNTSVGYGADGVSGSMSEGIHLPPSDVNSLSADPEDQSLLTSQEQPKTRGNVFLRFARRLDVILGVLLVIGLAVAGYMFANRSQGPSNSESLKDSYGTISIPLEELVAGKDLTVAGASNVTINGPLQLTNSFSLAPSLQPTGAKAGQIYYDQTTNQLAYFNGTNFVFLTSPTPASAGLQSLGGATGQLTVGQGLSMNANELSNSGVLSVQGQNGNVNFTAGPGLIINGTTFSNSGVLSLAAGTPNVTVDSDGNGNLTISVATSGGGGSGTVTSSGSVSAGTIPLFTSSQNIEGSIISQSGFTVTISGDLSVVTGGLSLSNALTVPNGGTGAASLAANGVLVGQGTAAITSVTSGGAGLCLLSTAGAPTWAACPTGSGVTSLNGLTGGLNIANASAAGSTITIDNASTTTKGIASFNGTNFSVTNGAVNTVQDINAAATPTFAGVNTNTITPNAALTVGVSAQTALLQGSTTTITSNGAGNDITLNSANAINLLDNTFISGDITTSGNIALNGGNLTSTGALNITPGGALTVGSTTQALTLQGGATTSMRATSGANTTIVAFTNPVANTTLNFPALSAGTYTICTTSGNCAGAGVTLQAAYSNSSTPEITLDATRGALTIRDNSTPIGGNLFEVQNNAGSSTYLAVTTSGATVTGTIGASGNINSSGGAIQTNGTTRIDNSGNLVNIAAITASGNASLQGGNITLGTNAQAGAIVINDGSSNTGTLQVAALGQNTVYVLPDPGTGTATICLTTGNCAGTGGGVTTSGGTTNRLAKFTAGQAIGDSSISDNGTTVTTTGNVVIQGGSTTIGVAGTQSGTLFLAYGGAAFTGSIATDTLTANQNYLLPNATGTFCLTSGNCAGVGGTGDILQGGNNFGTAMTLGTNDNFAFNFETNGTTRMTIANDGSQITFGGNLDLILQGATAYISNSQGQTNSEAFGLNASTTGGNAVAVGNGATAIGSGVSVGRSAGVSSGAFGGPVSIGENANAGAWGVAIGQNSLGSGNDGVAIGNGAATGQAAVAIGSGASAALNGVALGEGAVTGGNNRIVIGHAATATADNQLVIGSDSTYIDEAYIGNGVSSAAPVDTRIHATGGSGTDVGGADLSLAAGAGTGSAAGGNLNFQVATPGASGSSANVPTTVASLSGTNGSALFKNLVNSVNAFQVQTAGGAAVLTVDTTTNGTVLAGDLAVNGGDLTSTGALNITPGGTLTVGVTGQQLILQGSANTRLTATGNGFTTTVGFTGTATGAVTYNFDRAATAGTYNICTSIGNCAGAGGGVTTSGGTTGTIAKFTGAQTLADSLLSESGSTVTVNGNLNLTSGHQFSVNGTQISSANLSNDANLAKLSASQTFTGSTVAFQNGTNSTNAFNIQNAAGNRVVTVDTTNGRLTLGTASALSGTLVFQNMTNANTVTIVPGTPTGNRTLTLPDASGIICTDSGNCAGAGATLQTSYNFSVGGTTPKIKVNNTLLGVDIQDADTTIAANLFNIRASNAAGLGSVLFGVGSTGDVTIQNSANSTSAFRLLTAGGTSVLTGDTTNGQVILGQSGTLSGSLVLKNATNANTTTIALTVPTANRTITLPNATGTVCLTSGNCSGAGSSNTLQAAYDAGNTITTTTARDISFAMADTATDANFLVDLQCDTSCSTNGRFAIQDDGTDVFTISPAGGAMVYRNSANSTNAFQIQNAAGTRLVNIDTVNDGSALFGIDSTSKHISFDLSTNDGSIDVGATGGNLHLTLKQKSNSNAEITHDADLYVKGNNNSTTNFQIQNAAGTALFNADTTNGRIGIGGVASFSKFEVIGGDAAVYNSGNNPRLILGDSTSAGQNGYLQWDSTNDYFRIETAGTNGLKINDNFLTIGNIFPDQPLKVANGTTLLHQISTTGAALFRNSSNSSTAFQVQKADSTTLLNVDTSSNITTLAGDLIATGIQPASVATNGTIGSIYSLTAAKGGNTTGTTGQTAGNGGNFYITAGAGGNAPAGSTNGWGGSVVIDGGVAGSGAGGVGLRGNVILQSAGGVVGIGTVSPNFNYRIDAAGDINISSGSAYRINGTSICTSSGCTASSASAILNQSSSTQTGNFRIVTSGDTVTTGVIRTNGTQTADLLQFQTSGGVPVAGVRPSGAIWSAPISSDPNTEVPANARLFVQPQANASTAIIARAAAGGAPTGDILQLQSATGSANYFTVGAAGAITGKVGTTNTAAFDIQDTNGDSLLRVDTTNNMVKIGYETGTFNGANASLVFGDDCGGDNSCTSIFEGNDLVTNGTGDTDVIQVQGAAGIRFSTSYSMTSAMVINGSGEVGIGTEDPTEKLSVVGNLSIQDAATATKNYRFRTSGSALDVEGAGADLYISSWTGADFTGTQQVFLRGFIGTSGNSYNDRGLFVGNATASSNPMVFVLAEKSSASGTADPVNTGFVGAMYYNRALESFRCYQNGWRNCLAGIAKVTSQQSTTSTSYSTITGLSWAVAANTDYTYRCVITFTSAATTTGFAFATNGPASPNFNKYVVTWQDVANNTASNTATRSSYQNANDGMTAWTDAAGANTNLIATIEGTFSNGANAGTLSMRYLSEVNASAITVKTGSSCTYY